jgi:general stress protein YciG
MANTSSGSGSTDTSKRGFASMADEQQREIASKGGHSQGRDNNPGNFANDPDRAAEAGRKGGESQGRENNPGNFANDRNKAAEAGRHGGQARGSDNG